MSLREIYYDKVKSALIKDGWTITHDPLRLFWDGSERKIELESVLGAEKADQLIAITIGSFVGPSDVSDLERALGQYLMCRLALQQQQPGYDLYLAVSEEPWYNVFAEPIGKLALERMRLLVFSSSDSTLQRWVSGVEQAVA
jgi:hypothetical protein